MIKYEIQISEDKNSLAQAASDLIVKIIQSTLKNKSLRQIIQAQRQATQIVFRKKKIPFRSIEVLKRNEETIGELFSFFVLETILLGRVMKVNPYDQPAVELIKTETSKILN